MLCLLCLTSFARGEVPDKRTARLTAAIDSIIQANIDNDRIPGAVILITKDTATICNKAFGYARKYDYERNLLNPPEIMTIDHLFDIASLTKVIGTTTSIMLLADRGLIKIDDPVCKYIKAFDTTDKRRITIRNLLTHTAGLYQWYPLYYRASDKQECYRLIAELPLKFQIGVRRRYSDLGFVILGEIIESVSGLPLDRFMEENIFIPLGMKNTTYNPLRSGQFTKIAATSAGNQYEMRMVKDPSLGFKFPGIDPDKWNGWRNYMIRGEVNDGNAWYALGGVSGAAGLFSTAGDLQKLVSMLINRGKAGTTQFISSATVAAFLTRDRYRNGLGWIMDNASPFMKNAPQGSFGHTGYTGTSIAVILKDKISVILLINRQNTGFMPDGQYFNVNRIRQQIFSAVLKYLRAPDK